MAVSCCRARKRETRALRHYLRKPAAQRSQGSWKTPTTGSAKSSPVKSCSLLPCPPPHSSHPFRNPCLCPFAATPPACLAVSRAGQRGKAAYRPSLLPPSFRSLSAPQALPEPLGQACMFQAPRLSPPHRLVAHLSPLPQCTQLCIYILCTTRETVLHGSFQELSWSSDPALAPLAPEAPNCGHHGRSPSKMLYRTSAHCCIIMLS